MTSNQYHRILDATGSGQDVLSDRTRWDLLQAWRRVYAELLQAATGRWKHGKFEWHVFSYGYARALNRERAAQAYATEKPIALIVCPESQRIPAVRLTGGRLPDFRAEGDDVYVWAEDLTWTMAFTHEESMGLGPYFCRQEWVVGPPRVRH